VSKFKPDGGFEISDFKAAVFLFEKA